MKVGDLVKVHPCGKSVFTVIEVDEGSGTAFIEAVEDSPGRYPWTALLSELVPADE